MTELEKAGSDAQPAVQGVDVWPQGHGDGGAIGSAGCLLNIPAACECISGTDLLR